jgi:cytochrome c-type biogenesis protein CcmH/NrfG
VTKDNLISVVLGVLLGFIAGYLTHEVMEARQPPRFASQAPGAAPQGMPQGTFQPSPDMPPGQQPPMGAAAGGGAPMQEIQQLRERVAQNPNDADAVRQLADMNFDISNWQRAQELYAQYLALRPGDVDVLSDLGVVEQELGNYDEALRRFDQVQEQQPDHWQSMYNEVIVRALNKKDFDGAQETLQRLQQLQPDNPNVQRLAAEVQKQRNAT